MVVVVLLDEDLTEDVLFVDEVLFVEEALCVEDDNVELEDMSDVVVSFDPAEEISLLCSFELTEDFGLTFFGEHADIINISAVISKMDIILFILVLIILQYLNFLFIDLQTVIIFIDRLLIFLAMHYKIAHYG